MSEGKAPSGGVPVDGAPQAPLSGHLQPGTCAGGQGWVWQVGTTWGSQGSHPLPTPFISCLGQGLPGPRPTQPEGWGPRHADSVPFPGRNHLPLRPLCVAGSSGEARKESLDWRRPKRGQDSIHES